MSTNHTFIRRLSGTDWYVIAPRGRGDIIATVPSEHDARRIASAMDAKVAQERAEEERQRAEEAANDRLTAYVLRYYADRMRADLQISAEDGAVLWLKSAADRLDPIGTVE